MRTYHKQSRRSGKKHIFPLLLIFLLLIGGYLFCKSDADLSSFDIASRIGRFDDEESEDSIEEIAASNLSDRSYISESDTSKTSDSEANDLAEDSNSPSPNAAFDVNSLPAYQSQPYTLVNGNKPYFTDDDITVEEFEEYSKLDRLGRCGTAFANICKDLMPTEERGEIGQVKPTGWHTVKYETVIEDKYLYNRCHLIGYQLSGENANEKNLITGTRYMNVEGMEPFENQTAYYVKKTGNHVLYRVTPIFEGDNLLASGVLMEAYSVEDGGDGLQFCVYCYNVQPGVELDYATGDSKLAEDGDANSQDSDSRKAAANSDKSVDSKTSQTRGLNKSDENVTQEDSSREKSSDSGNGEGTNAKENADSSGSENATEMTYIININTGKFHYPSCSSVGDMKEKNKKEFTGSREDLIADGYEPCQRCNP